MRINVAVQTYAAFLELKTHFGDPVRVFYNVDSGDIMNAYAEYEDDSVTLAAPAGTSEGTFLGALPEAIEITGSFSVQLVA